MCPITENGGYLLWSNFEKAIENVETNSIVDWNWENLLVAETTFDNFLVGSTPSFLDTQLSEIIFNVFGQWVRSIHIESKQLIDFKNESLYLTFNYTDTLEKVYKITENNILHIHGRASIDENLIVGHRNYIDPIQYLTYATDFREDNHRIDNVCDYNKLYKPIEYLIDKNRSFFDQLSHIKSIVIIGHSCNDIDKLYFKEVSKHVSNDTHWLFFWHDEVIDLPNIKLMIEFLQLDTGNYSLEYN